MNRGYNFIAIEKKWQKYWETQKTFEVTEDESIAKEKRKYVLDMFPYPSAAGLHVGHPEGYTATDIYARFLRMNGYHVLHPMGFDSFGLPAENYAIKTKTHPRVTTEKNIVRFREQIKRLGFSYDWSREVSTHQKEYYQWTQWIFLQLYKKGLAYQKEMPVWYCSELGTVLANEEVLNTDEGPRSERGMHPVERRHLVQWMLQITSYAERLLEDLEELDWPESIKIMQRNWIGKSEGAEILFSLPSSQETIEVFSTRPDTLWGATYMVLAPEHPLLESIVPESHRKSVRDYQLLSSQKSDLERMELNKEKSGVYIGVDAINPVNGKNIPIWISDYVIMGYGTGAIMAVPAHDARDWDFAKKFSLPIDAVISKDPQETEALEEAYTGDGYLVNSDNFSGMHSKDAIPAIITWLEENSFGKKQVNYKLRDWIFSRQRYWGEPIPILKKPDGTVFSLEESELPLYLPEISSYEPSGTGESPLAAIHDWCTVSMPDGGTVQRETHTMPQWAGSCWYYLRFLDPHNDKELASQKNIQYWMPVDLYLGGAEHAVLHLLYARFWHKVLYDLNIVNTKEPFHKLINQGMILGEDGNKMSKSLGNVINPDEIIDQFGADSLRLYEMFMGPLRQEKPWVTNGLKGIYRFLNKVWNLQSKKLVETAAPEALRKTLHQSIQKISENIQSFLFNTAIAQLMILCNEMGNYDVRYTEVWRPYVLLLAPFAPHIAEELWEEMGNSKTLSYEEWPKHRPEFLTEDQVELVVQINGKLRAKATIPIDLPTEEVEKLVLDLEKVQHFLDKRVPKKIIIVPNKIVNIVC